ncbi:GAF domain-containing protein [Sphingomonas mollis]|uniref:GAF domain-containing protein n=1 Tax=Sphingomonas mollis TaxID=2795726 RepID=UPI002FCE3B0F
MSEQIRLATLDAYRLLDTPPERQFDAIVRAAAESSGAPISTITLVDGSRQWFKAKLGLEHDGDPIADSICAHAMHSDEVFVVNDASQDDRFRHMAGVASTPGIRFYAGAPLRASDGARLGTLCIIDVEPRAGLEDEERRMLETLARRTMAAFELRREAAATSAGASDAAILARALDHLARASALLDHVDATGATAHLERVIAMVEELRSSAPADQIDRDRASAEIPPAGIAATGGRT